MMLSDLAGAALDNDVEIRGLTADSRLVRPGYLFAALPGVKFDGARFIPQALEMGAAAVLGPPGTQAAAPVIADADPRRRFARMAAAFYGDQPAPIAAVTGTNGKTSVVRFTAQLWRLAGRAAASMGTIGVEGPNYSRPLRHTTPDPAELHEILAELAKASPDCALALEASSHGLAQRRLDGVRVAAAAFTNITQDHLDYHADFEDYFAAKSRLFTDILDTDGVAIINADGEGAARVQEICAARGLRILTTGRAGRDLRLVEASPHGGGQHLVVELGGGRAGIDLPLIGAFQAENALLAAGIVCGLGAENAAEIVALLGKLTPVRGRMELVGETADGASVFVDYAHTPDAVENALASIRPHVGGRLHVIIGAGGDRDRDKRPKMGAAAARGADAVIVTDDNPRSEEPGEIRAAVMAGCPDAREIGDRAEAIAAAIRGLAPGDALVIAGKGHETGQTIGERTIPFDDADIARGVLRTMGGRA